MIQQKRSTSGLPPFTSIPGFRKEKGKEPQVLSSSMQLPRRRASAIRVTFNEDSTDSEQRSQQLRRSSSSARLLRLAPKTALRSLDTSSTPSLRTFTKTAQKHHGAPVQITNSFRSKVPSPLRLDERDGTPYPERPLSGREPTSPSYEEQFRRRRGDLLHRFGKSVPYMQAYDPTSLQCDALTTRLLEYLCEPGTPCFHRFQNRGEVTTVLDLGCGPQLLWVTTAARFWPNAKIIGVDCIRPSPEVQIPSNVEFLKQNFLDKLSPITTESVDLVRMSCLGTSIPEGEWPVVLTEVRRILKPGGVVEIIDDELHPAYVPEDQIGRLSLTSTEGRDNRTSLHPIDQYFRQMLVERYGMPETPHKTIGAAMEITFGAYTDTYFRVELPSRKFKTVETEETRRGGNLLQAFLGKKDVAQLLPYDTPTKAQRVLGLTNGSAAGDRVTNPFLIFPYGLCHLDASEVRMAACGGMHKVLSCRASLIDFIVGSGAEGERLDDVTNKLWAYEGFYQNMLNLPDDDWNDLGREHKGPGKEPPTVHRTSTDSCDSGYASQSSNTVRARKGKASTSLTSDNNNCTLVRRFWVFHAVKV